MDRGAGAQGGNDVGADQVTGFSTAPPNLPGANSVSRSRYRVPHSQKSPETAIGTARTSSPSRKLQRSSIQPTIGGEITSPNRWMIRMLSANALDRSAGGDTFASAVF